MSFQSLLISFSMEAIIFGRIMHVQDLTFNSLFFWIRPRGEIFPELTFNLNWKRGRTSGFREATPGTVCNVHRRGSTKLPVQQFHCLYHVWGNGRPGWLIDAWTAQWKVWMSPVFFCLIVPVFRIDWCSSSLPAVGVWSASESGSGFKICDPLFWPSTQENK